MPLANQYANFEKQKIERNLKLAGPLSAYRRIANTTAAVDYFSHAMARLTATLALLPIVAAQVSIVQSSQAGDKWANKGSAQFGPQGQAATLVHTPPPVIKKCSITSSERFDAALLSEAHRSSRAATRSILIQVHHGQSQRHLSNNDGVRQRADGHVRDQLQHDERHFKGGIFDSELGFGRGGRPGLHW